ncbi:prolyl 4-hydroxylase subunit alpha-2 isoform X2 [Teleopsis dalmanni]|uniref:prolyl 4-hydroxylase subunit alpha-2 isoform X2 n=1 Tax=Teleopsis dalmanni TaxID=139649 RepID=UPI0018CD72E0|nr:prolyl 4-hydroxylase subunit alpha-2 isoform X2 [Teleopsis dalmanni]
MPMTRSFKTAILAAINTTKLLATFILAFIIFSNTTKTEAAYRDNIKEFLSTETSQINFLRQYTQLMENSLMQLKRKTTYIANIHNKGSNDTETYLHNPINALNILKRLTTDWTQIIDYAEKLEPSEVEMNLMAMEENLAYPTERDYDESVANLLRLQQFYNLEPEHLSIGEMNGIKFGSEMTWSDCLEIGRQSLIIGNQNIAKFWIELALSKLPTTSKNISSTAKNTIFEVLKAVLNTEYASGNFNKSHDIVKKMLELKPTHKGAQKAKTQIESKVRSKTGESKKNIEKKKKLKTTEEVWFEEICREATFTTQAPLSISAQKLCKLDRGNFPQLFLQPLKVEFLSVNPLIVIYHEIFTLKQLDNLRNLLKIFKSDNRAVEEYQIEDILMSIKQILQLVTGYSSIKLSDWKTDCNSFENFGPFDAEYYKITSANIIGTTFLNFQASKLGGAIVFPQLEVGINIPVRSLLYWSNLNEFHEVDYRTEAHLCPVIIGTQISATAFVQKKP